MKKIAIVTIRDTIFNRGDGTLSSGTNYGGSLQNYATHQVFRNIGCSARSLCYTLTKRGIAKIYLLYLRNFIYRGLRRFSKAYRYEEKIERLRFIRFNNFYLKHIPTEFITETDKLSDKFDYFAIGSDQVWNAGWYGKRPIVSEMYLLEFAKPEQKICIAPSFGVEKLPDEWEEHFKESLMTFPKLYVREKSGVDLIKNLTGQRAEVMIDPTLMLTCEQWKKIERKPKFIDTRKKYILTYFLGDVSEERKAYIESLSKEHNMEVYNLFDKDNIRMYTASPDEFVYLISHAGLILTDSFHACVFSFIFEKPFLVFDREDKEMNMFSRIETLLEMLSIERKYVKSGISNDLFECDYEDGKKVIEEERKKAYRILKNAISGERVK